MWFLYLVLPALDRLGGSINNALRRFGIPIVLLVYFGFTIPTALRMGVLCAILCLDFDAIENRNWGAVWCKAIAIGWCCGLTPVWMLAFSGWWMVLTLWANCDWVLQTFRLDWKYVEIMRLVPICLAIQFGGSVCLS